MMEEKKELEKQTVFKEDEQKETAIQAVTGTHGEASENAKTTQGQSTSNANHETTESEKTAIGLDENITGALAYLFWFITGIIFLLLEKDNKFVRFHAMQSIVFFAAYFLISVILGFIPIIGLIFSILMAPIGIIIALFLMYKAYKGEMFKLPIVGDMAEQFLNK